MVRGSRIRRKGFEWNWVNGGEVGEVRGLRVGWDWLGAFHGT